MAIGSTPMGSPRIGAATVCPAPARFAVFVVLEKHMARTAASVGVFSLRWSAIGELHLVLSMPNSDLIMHIYLLWLELCRFRGT